MLWLFIEGVIAVFLVIMGSVDFLSDEVWLIPKTIKKS
jgi:hypothetical protein